MLKYISIAIILSTTSIQYGIAQNKESLPIYKDASKPINERVEDALARMTLEEKVAMVHAQSKFSSPGVSRLGIPEFWMTDGPHGIRAEGAWDSWDQANWTNDSCIAYPALTALAATWNEDMSFLYGKSIGEDARYRKKDVLLGPGVNIYRTPLNGRNFEYMGEDPFLSATMAVPYIQGVQSNGVAACVKHFALNNQETNRHTTNVNVDDRTLYEIYLPAFKAAVQKGGAWAIMGAYNLYKGQHACHNQYLLNDILRDEWGFDGVVISDWGGVNNTKQSIYNGLDMEFGSWTDGLSNGYSNAYDNFYMATPYLELIKKGEVGTKELDEKVRNILRLGFRTNMDKNRPDGSFATPEHSKAAREIAQESIVLLQNENNVLPINLSKTKKIAVIGENAIKMMTVGGGSSSLKVKYEISPLQGLKERLKDNNDVEIVYARGYVGDASGNYNGVVSGQNLTDYRVETALFAEAVELAKNSDYVIFIGGLNKSDYQDNEGMDRKSYELPYHQNELLTELAKVNKNLVFVNVSGNAVAMPWTKQVPTILQAWYLGSESGYALASILVGDVSPSGKLPFSFPVKLDDLGSHKLGEYPGKIDELIKGKTINDTVNVTYNEGIYVGYRWLDKEKVRPLFSFGHGLSYSSFVLSDAKADKAEMTIDDTISFSVKVTNTGKVAASEVVQLYVNDVKSSVDRPMKELKGFKKVFLQPGESKVVEIVLDKEALSFFDPVKHDWVAETGAFFAWIGTASDNIVSKVKFYLK